MSDRGVIAAHWLRNSITDDMEHDDNDWSTFCQCGHRIADTTATDIEALHRAHVVATLRESRTVRTMEDLDALPEGTVLRLHSGEIVMLDGPGCDTGQRVQHWEWSDCCGLGAMHLPARVLYRPDEDGGDQ